jgi:hypothetical protein
MPSSPAQKGRDGSRLRKNSWETWLVGGKPRKDWRDIVQFVELRNFLLPGGGWSHELLAQSVLAEVPGQVRSWMKSIGCTPRERVESR